MNELKGAKREAYLSDYRRALVRLQEAQEAHRKAEQELAEAAPIEAALKTLLGGKPFAGMLSTSSARWRIAEELGGWQLGFDTGNVSTRLNTLLMYVNQYDAVSRSERTEWAADLVDIEGEVESWRIRLRKDFDDNCVKFVLHYAPTAGFARAQLAPF